MNILLNENTFPQKMKETNEFLQYFYMDTESSSPYLKLITEWFFGGYNQEHIKKNYFYALDLDKACVKWENNFYKEIGANRVFRVFKPENDYENVFNSNYNMQLLKGHPDLLNPVSITNLKLKEDVSDVILVEYEDVKGI